jgi:hypothetical protein
MTSDLDAWENQKSVRIPYNTMFGVKFKGLDAWGFFEVRLFEKRQGDPDFWVCGFHDKVEVQGIRGRISRIHATGAPPWFDAKVQVTGTHLGYEWCHVYVNKEGLSRQVGLEVYHDRATLTLNEYVHGKGNRLFEATYALDGVPENLDPQVLRRVRERL